MVFVEFVSSNYPSAGDKHHFVGKDLAAVLAYTNGGKRFGFADFTSHREITEADARALGLGYLDEGIECVQKKRTLAFMLKTP